MIKKNLLEHMQILDLTQRLPGPLASNILGALGAKVTKVEPPQKQDTFALFAKEDPLFGKWYHALNHKKEMISLSHSYDELIQLLEQSQIILVSKDAPLIEELKRRHSLELAVVEVCGSKNNISMHDINALAMTKGFQLYIHDKTEDCITPPYLPIAGITFGQHLATEALATYLKAQATKQVVHTQVFIDETASFIFDHFWHPQWEEEMGTRFLHNGKYPCYNLYKTQDLHYIALAAVEDKFWHKFVEIFKLPLKSEDRFDTSTRVFNILINKFNKLTLNDIKGMVGDQDICLTSII